VDDEHIVITQADAENEASLHFLQWYERALEAAEEYGGDADDQC
jgi:hypothetical protein